MSEHTPGPWRQRPEDPKFIATDEDIGMDIARVLWVGDDREANARLIAAAPELLEAAKALVEDLDPLDTFVKTPVVVVRVKEAIKKAEGRA